jgi:dihydrofolate synthase/folylpolyglutamate synthase
MEFLGRAPGDRYNRPVMGKPTPVDPRAAPRRPVEIDVPASAPAPPRTYEEALAFLNARTDVEQLRPSQIPAGTLKLDRMVAMVEALHHPDREFKSVHVAGSKGKGSVCEMTAAALAGCGYAVGLYTSPHLVNIRERIRVAGEPISPQQFASAIGAVAQVLPAIERKFGPATYFEILTAAALVHFAEQAVDFAVLEVGLGGRLDSTNVVQPEVAAITAIHLEHTQLLGDTLEKIAREKAGIMKPGVRTITFGQKPEVLAVFRDTAAAVGSPLAVVGQDIEFTSRFEANPELGQHHRVCLTTARSNFEHIAVPLKGEHQAANCGLVLAIIDALRDRGHTLPDQGVANGLAGTRSQGRLELVHKAPRIIVDGAHTPESIQALLRAIGTHLKYDNLIIVFGCSADKDVPGMLSKLAGGADKIVFTRSGGSARAAEPRDLQKKFAEVSGKQTQAAPSVKDAINLAAKAAQRGDLIAVTGSFYVAGEAKRLIVEKLGGG